MKKSHLNGYASHQSSIGYNVDDGREFEQRFSLLSDVEVDSRGTLNLTNGMKFRFYSLIP